MYQTNYKICEVLGISKDNLQRSEISGKNNYFRQIVKFTFQPKNELKRNYLIICYLIFYQRYKYMDDPNFIFEKNIETTRMIF